MRRTIGKLTIALLMTFIMSAAAVNVLAIPPPPHRFYGSVTIAGEPAPDALIEAKIAGVTYATTTTVDGKYGYAPNIFDVPADDPETPEKEGGVGETVEFYVDGTYAASKKFESGAYTKLDLSVAGAPPDTEPPVISTITVSGITTSGASIRWFTDEPATGHVEYGKTIAYGLTSATTSMGTSHTVTLTGLASGTEYHFRVVATDEAENTAYSSDDTFTTSTTPGDTEPPTISDLKPEPGTTVNATQPTISAKYSDNVAINTGSVQLTLNGVDVTAQATVTSTGVSYTPTEPLANATTHTVKVSVADTSGNKATREWNFTVLVLLPPPPTPARFEVSNLLITPSEVNAGETVSVRVTVSNVGEETGDYTVTLWINDVVEDTRTITLDGGKSVEVTFTATEADPGTYNVKVDGLTVTFVVKVPLKPAEFELSSLSVTPAEVQTGESVTVSVRVSNVGEQTGGYNVTLRINDIVEDYEAVTLDGGESTTVSFSLTKDAGEYSVKVDGLTGSFKVVSPPAPFPWEYVIAAAAIIVVIVVIAIVMKRR